MNKLLQLIISLRDEASAGIEKLNGSLGRMAEVAGGNLLAGAIEAAGQAVVGLGATTLSAASDFESATARFASVAGGALGEAGFALDDVKNKALELGAVTQFSAAQAQDAMINLAKGGVPVKDIMGEATQATLDLAAAGELELAQAADIVSKQLGVWGDTGVKAADVSNLLAQAANASTVDVDELALGLANVGGVAKVSGVSFQDLTQTMAMIAPGFSSAADAGTSLKTFILSLQPTTKSAVAAMNDLGLMSLDTTRAMETLREAGINPTGLDTNQLVGKLQSLGLSMGLTGDKLSDFVNSFNTSVFYDAQGQFVGMDKAAGLLSNSLSGLSEAEQSAALKAIFGTDAFRAAALIAHNGSAGFQAMGQAMDAAGTAAEQAAIRNATFKFAFDSLKGSIETIQIIVGSALLPVLTDLVNNALIPGANAVMAFAQALTSSANPWQTFVDMLNGVLPGLGTFVDFLGNQIQPILAAVGAAILTFIVPAFWAWATAATATAAANIAALLPIIGIAAAIAAVVGLVVAAWTNDWGGIQGIVASVWAYLQPILAAIGEWLGQKLVAAGQALAAFWSGTLWPALEAVGAFITGTVVPALAELWNWLGVQLVAAGQALATFWNGTLWPALQAVGTFITGTVVPAFVELWNWLSTNIPAAVATVVAAFNSVITTIQGIAASVQAGWSSLVTTTTTAWNAAVTAVQGYILSIQTSIETGLSVVTTIIQAIWNTVVFITTAAWNAIVVAIMPIIQSIGAAIGPPLTAAVQAVATAWQWLSDTAATIWTSITTAVSTAVAAVLAVLESIGTPIAEALNTAWSGISSAASTAWAGITSTVSTATSGITAAASTAGAETESALTTAWNSISAVAATTWGAISAAVEAAVSTMVSIVTSQFTTIETETAGIWARIQTAVQTAIDGIKGVIQTGVDIATNIVTTAWDVIVAASQNKFDEIPKIVSGAWEDIKKAFSGGVEDAKKVWQTFANDAVNIGKSVVDGLVKGIKNGLGSVLEAARSIARSAYDAAMGALKAHSPSKLFADVGDTIPSGMAVGIEKGMPAVNDTMIKSVGALVDSVGKVVDSGMKSLRSVSAYEGPGGSGMSGFVAGIVAFATQLADAATLVGAAMMANAQKFAESAAKIFDMASKGVDVLTKIGNLGTVAPAAMQTFVTGMVQLITLLVAATATVDQTGFAAAQKFAEGGGKILGVIGTGVDALNKLATLSAAVPGSFLRFALYVRVLIGRMAELSAEVSQDAMSAAIRFADGGGRVLAVLGAGVDALNKLAGMSDAVPGSFLKFATYVRVLIGRMAELAAEVSQEAMSAAIKFAEGGGKVLAILKAGVDALNALANLADAVPGSFLKFATYVRVLIGRMAEMAAQVDQEALSAAVRFAEAAGKILGILKAGVDGLNALAGFVAPAWDAMANFRQGLGQWVGAMVQLASWFEGVSLDGAVTFAEAAAKILAILKTGVDGFGALAGFVAPAWDAMANFRQGLGQWVGAMVQLASWFEGVSLDGAVTFAEAAAKILAILKTGVDGFEALSTMQDVPKSAFESFGVALAQIVSVLWSIAAQFTADGLAAAAAFADTGGKVVGILKNGVDGLNALDDLGPISEAAIGRFATAINQTMVLLGAAASQFSADAIAQAGKFAEAAGKAVGILKTGTEGLLMVDTFTGVSEAAIGRFAAGVQLAVAAMARLAAEFGPEATAAANAFAKAAGESTDFLKKGVEGFIKLGDLKEIPAAGLRLFAQGVVAVVQTIGQLSTILTTDALAQAISVANGTDTVIEVIKNALKAFILLGQAASEIPNYVASFQQAVNTLSGNMQKLVVPPAQNIGLAMSLGIAAGITAGTPAIQNAIVGALQAALASARAALGIASPSRVFDELVGYQGGAGVAQGFERSIPMVQAAAGSMAAASITPVAAAASASASPMGSRGFSGGGGGAVQTLTIEKGAITIVQQPGESGDAVAQKVMRLIEAKYRLRG